MAGSLQLRVVTPEETRLVTEAVSLRFPGDDGLFGVLPRHAAMLSLMSSGELRARAADGSILRLLVHRGFAEVRDNVVTILTDAAEDPDALDAERAEKSAQRARERLRSRDADIDHCRAEAALERALARLRTSSAMRS